MRDNGPDRPFPSVLGIPMPFFVAFCILLAALAVLTLVVLDRFAVIDDRMTRIDENLDSAMERVDEAQELAHDSRTQAVAAQRLAEQSEEKRQQAVKEAELALARATEAEEEAVQARQEADRVKKEREEEIERLESALNQIADTQRTALGLVMNLGSDHLQFDFNKASLRPENREILSRIAGILLTSKGFSVQVWGHTDDIGSERYNQELSEKRAETVRNYLVKAGISPSIITTQGFGKTRPLVDGSDARARAKNRRVEIGIVQTNVRYSNSKQIDDR